MAAKLSECGWKLNLACDVIKSIKYTNYSI